MHLGSGWRCKIRGMLQRSLICLRPRGVFSKWLPRSCRSDGETVVESHIKSMTNEHLGTAACLNMQEKGGDPRTLCLG